MPNFQLRPKDKKTYEKIKEILQETKILKTQDDLQYGHWDFVVVGPSSKTNTVIRKGYAQQARILSSPVYLATIMSPNDATGGSGIPIEEIISGVPEDLMGMEVLQIDPVRPFSIDNQSEGPDLKEAVKQVMKRYDNENIAIIETPDEKYWGISVMKYLNDFDRAFPDSVTEAIRTGNLPISGSLLDWNKESKSNYYH